MSTDLPPLKNRLADAASPYLRQHADNPVAWQCWDEAALRRARIEDKPIFLSIGYAACHWCHVMERESFSSPAVAAILNSRFIPVKVDREERPDLDEVYMTAVTAMTGAGGWPLSVFLTPDGLPFYGDTYFPPVDRWGKPAFTRVLLHVAGLWKEQRHRVVEGAAELAELIRRRLRPPLIAEGTDSLETILEDAVRKLEEDFDPHHGGWGAGSKFPPSGTLQWLLRRVAYRGDANAERMLRKTLDAMATGGLRDHVGGGFHRYTVDPEWQVPHFEKMLYDNALLARVFLEAGRVLDAPRYLDVGRDTLEYLIREMRDPSGGFHASEDADSGGREGMFYLWNPDEVRAALSPEDADWFMERFAILSEGNFHSHEPFHQGWSIPRLETPLTPGESARFEKIRASLRKHRLKRPAPPRDPKIIASWNGLMLSALAEAVRALGDKAYAETATRCADLLISRHFHNQAGLRSVLGDQEGPPAVLEDFAAVAVGLLDLHEVTGETRWLRSALSLTRTMIDRFSAGGLEQGFYRTATDTRDLPMSAVPWQDGQEPGPNTLAMAALRKLGLLLQEDAWLAASEKWLLAHAGLARRFPEAVPFLLALMEESVQGPVTITVRARPGNAEKVYAMLSTLWSRFLFHGAVAAADLHNAAEFRVFNGKDIPETASVAAWICGPSGCFPPVSAFDGLSQLLDAAGVPKMKRGG